MRATLNTKALVAEAKRNPWKLFNCGELGAILGVCNDTVAAISNANDTPFCGKKARPEWLLRWLENHPGWCAK